MNEKIFCKFCKRTLILDVEYTQGYHNECNSEINNHSRIDSLEVVEKINLAMIMNICNLIVVSQISLMDNVISIVYFGLKDENSENEKTEDLNIKIYLTNDKQKKILFIDCDEELDRRIRKIPNYLKLLHDNVIHLLDQPEQILLTNLESL